MSRVERLLNRAIANLRKLTRSTMSDGANRRAVRSALVALRSARRDARRGRAREAAEHVEDGLKALEGIDPVPGPDTKARVPGAISCATEALEALQIDDVIPGDLPTEAIFLKLEPTASGYPNTTLDFIALPRKKRRDFLKVYGPRDLYAYIWAPDWPGVFPERHPTFDYYDEPDRVIEAQADCAEAGKRLCPILLDNTWSGPWDPIRDKIGRGLRKWGKRDVPTLLAIEGNVTFGYELSADEHIEDALVSSDNGILTEFPWLDIGVHGQGLNGLRVPSARWLAYQFDWHSHTESDADIAEEMRQVRAFAGSRRVVWFEYAQHIDATSDDALRMRRLITSIDRKSGYAC